jgi:ferredoxin
MKSYLDCSGCGVCALVCPVWTQQNNIEYTPWGRAKAVQGGATAAELSDSLESCVSCGACEVVCPETIGLQNEESLLRKVLGQIEDLEDAVLGHHKINFYPSSQLKIQGDWLRKLSIFLVQYGHSRDVITDHSQWHDKFLAEKKHVFGLGEWLIKKNLIQKNMVSGDLYWMDSKLFHSRYESLVEFYAKFREQSACELNWNLHRTAMPLGEENKFFERKQQFEWVLLGKNIKRLVVENVKDWKWMKENSTIPTVHVLELL